ncbi:MAG: DNA translocase FtsK [Candidatus Choladocola sp.]|nr:DNA translocase FtsK [Candidatus Choladocola sp.]
MASNAAKNKRTGTGNTETKRSVSKKAPAPAKSNKSGSSRSQSKTAAVRTSRQKTQPVILEEEKTNPLIMREAVLWIILAVCILIFISYFGIGGYVGSAVSDLCFGVFGISAYIFPFLLFIAAAFLISNKGSKRAGVKFVSSLVLYLCICSFAALFTEQYQTSVGMIELYENSASYKTGGGIIGGSVCSLLCPALGAVGTGVVLAIFSIVAVVLITQKSLMRGMGRQSRKVYHSAKESTARMREAHRQDLAEREARREERRQEAQLREEQRREKERREAERRTEERQADEPLKVEKHTKRTEIEVPVLFPVHSRESRAEHRVTGVTMDTKLHGDPERIGGDLHEITPRIPRTVPVNETKETLYIDLEERLEQNQETETVSSVSEPVQDEMALHIIGIDDEQKTDIPQTSNEDSYGDPYEKYDQTVPEENAGDYLDEDAEEDAVENTAKADSKNLQKDETEIEPSKHSSASSAPKKNPRSSQKEIEDGIASVEAEMAKAAEAVRPEYVFPPLELLKKGKGKAGGSQEQEIRKTALKLQQTLNSFGVHVTVTNVSCGPSVTRYELLPEQGVKVSRIVSLSDDIKLNLAAADIRIEAPIPGKAAVGIEVPNSENSAVALRDLLESEEFRKHPSRLAFATGKDIGGKVVVSDIARMPHLLIAGATGSGKSVCINTLIMSILYKAKPDEVKLIMIDPKVVELSVYNGIPHLFIPVVTDPKKAAGALNWGVAEMTDRYNKFAEMGVRDLKGYNQKIEAIKDVEDENKPKKLPQIVIIVDELADLMMVAPGEVEDSICRLAQLARAAGIHLIIATQRPSVNVITGLIKANMPSRIAFSVSSGVDSRTIIDMNGAEKLLGKGDMLFYPQGYQKPARVQGAFVSDEEVADVVDFLKNKNTDVTYNTEMEEQIAKVQQAVSAARGSEDTDALFADAGKFIIEKDKASIGMLQRVFKIGFNRAARIMDQLSDAGVVGPEEGTKPRKILMSQEEFENYLEQN